MKPFGTMIVLEVLLFSSQVGAQEKPMEQLAIRVIDVSPPGGFVVQVANVSRGPIKIWKESNIWGAARWRVLLIRDGKMQTFSQDPDQVFTRNIPSFDELGVGAQIEKRMDLNAQNWRGSEGRKADLKSGDTIIVIYDVPKEFGWVGAPVTIQARDMDVWYGVAAGLATVK